VHHHNGAVLLDGDDLRLKGKKLFHALGPLLSTHFLRIRASSVKKLKF
jgi:hypothetical protein